MEFGRFGNGFGRDGPSSSSIVTNGGSKTPAILSEMGDTFGEFLGDFDLFNLFDPVGPEVHTESRRTSDV